MTNTIFDLRNASLNLLFFLIFSSGLSAQQYKLWYDKPAQLWTEALPIGNGRMGAMIYGGTEKETIQFNEETVWSGQPHDYTHKGAFQYLDSLRNLLWTGKQKEAHEMGNKEFMSQPIGQQRYQPFGDVLLNFPGHANATNFYRDLSLNIAVTTVTYEVAGVKYKREVFASFPDQAIFIKISASKPKSLNFSVSMACPHQKNSITATANQLILKGTPDDYKGRGNLDSKISFESRLLVQNEGGKLLVNGNSINVQKANSVVLKLVAATNFVNYKDISANPTARCEAYLQKVTGEKYDVALEKHISDYQKLYNRNTIDLGKSELSNRPTNIRLNTYKEDNDPNMVSLLYQYGRYLLISSSRPGTQPANLQGIWNNLIPAKWGSKYTTNINTEMNYWLAEMTNLSECAQPLFEMIKDLSVTGQEVAKEHYNLKGWAFHHNTDIWRGAAPINDANHGIWMGGSGWMCQHLWWHYEYTSDKKFLSETAYPIMKGAAEFYAGYLVPDPKHSEWLISGPSNSPEQGGLVMGPTMDHQIIRNLFSNTIDAAKVLGVDAEFSAQLKDKMAKIAPNQIGKYGQLQEWLEDIDNPRNKHRHVSHMWGLHPGNEISPLTTPELAEACRVTLNQRGDDGTGWSLAWKINIWARLLDGEHTFQLLNKLIFPTIGTDGAVIKEAGGLYANLFDAHPPFQIDGNFGATSGITEMLLQTHLRDKNGDYYLDILPALPSKLATGNITGLVARGGFQVNIKWAKGLLVAVQVNSKNGNYLNIRYKGEIISLKTEKGKTYQFGADKF